MLDKIKLALRINNNAYDDEISLMILAAEKDLELAGVASTSIIETDKTEPTNNLIIQAIIFYCKGNFGFDNTEADRWLKCYDLTKQLLCLSYPQVES